MTKKNLTGLRAKVAKVIEAAEDWQHPDNEKYEQVISCLWRDCWSDKSERKYYDIEEFEKFLYDNDILLTKVAQEHNQYNEYGESLLSLVYRFANISEECFVAFTGWTSSDASCSEMSDWYFVKPVQKTVTVFEKE